ncbi:MAG TPA: ABC transporter ATP-binding protein [Spirochaetales bacterium]|nr:ABC transporter ATP-binding protein [Spirochaetales bacterium]HOV39738.1 ABC transporter ATP-binding protein [Spirochaetales bacterium]
MSYILETRSLTKQFGGITANLNIDIHIEEGKVVGLIGPNGSGKTTFINQVSGIIPPTSGEIFFRNTKISGLPACRIASLGVARTYQRIQLFDRMNTIENILVSRRKFITSTILDVAFNTRKLRQEEKEQYDKAMELLALFGLEKDAEKLPSNLPYGKRRAVEIARALALEPSLLLLDEPAAGMTKEEFKEILHIMNLLKERNITILLVEHTMEFIRQAVEWVYVLNFGQVIAQGPFDEIERDEAVIAAYLGDEE